MTSLSDLLSRPLPAREWDWLAMIADSSWHGGRGQLTAEEFICKYLDYQLPLPAWMDVAVKPVPPEAERAWQRQRPDRLGHVPLEHVVGSAKWQGSEPTWKEHLMHLGKPRHLYRGLCSPDTFAQELNHEAGFSAFTFGKLGDDYYNLDDGNNRLISAKFIGVRSTFGAIKELRCVESRTEMIRVESIPPTSDPSR